MQKRLIIFILCLATVMAAPLTVHPTNPRYFADDSGKAVYMTGSHNWAMFQVGAFERVHNPSNKDWDDYMQLLESDNHNFVRLWIIHASDRCNDEVDLTGTMCDNDDTGLAVPMPWSRVAGHGIANDGLNKYDLDQLNNQFFNDLDAKVADAESRGIYVSIMLFESFHVKYISSWRPWMKGFKFHVFNPDNNINGVDGDLNHDGDGNEVHTLADSTITNYQKDFVQKVIDTLKNHDNVLYEIVNEADGSSLQWQYHMINFIKQQDTHPVGITMLSQSDNIGLFNSPADWISPRHQTGQEYKTNPPVADGSKVIILDTDHLWGIGGDRVWVWKSFTRGHNPIYMDPLSNDPEHVAARKAMGDTLTYAEKMDIANVLPSDSSTHCSTRYCLRNPGQEYLVYQPGSGAFNVNLAADTYDYEWFNPATSTVAGMGTITVSSGQRLFTPPFSGDAVLYLNEAGSTCTDNDGDHYYQESNGCSGEPGFLGHDDCDDTKANVHPGATESCTNMIDDNCNQKTNEDCMVAHWSLEDGTDETGHNDLTINGAQAAGGKIGDAMLFDSDDTLVAQHLDMYMMDAGTFAFWFRADNLARQGVISKDSLGNSDGGHITFEVRDSDINARLQSTTQTYTLSAPIAADKWYHVAAAFGPGGFKLYINGSLVDQSSYTGGTGTTSGGSGNEESIIFGAHAGKSGDLADDSLFVHFNGSIDDVRIYSYELPLVNITQLYNLGLYHPADTDQDRCIDMDELVEHIKCWKDNIEQDCTIYTIIDALDIWRQGC